jgi:AAA+ superfamily predicted ATPase
MERLFADPMRRVYALYGNTGDYFCTPRLREVDLRGWLLLHLKSLGYRRVVFYSPTKKLHVLDAESARLARSPLPGDGAAKPGGAPAPGAAKSARLRGGPLGLARMHRRDSAAAATAATDAEPRWDFGTMRDDQAISALNRMMCEQEPTALVFLSGEDILTRLDPDAVRYWDDHIGEWVGARLPPHSRNIAILIFREDIDIAGERLPRLHKHLFGNQQQPLRDRAFRIGAAREDEVGHLLHRLRLRGEIRWTPRQIETARQRLAQSLIPSAVDEPVRSLGTLRHEVLHATGPGQGDDDPWQALRRAPGLAARVETPLRELVAHAKDRLAKLAPPPSPGPHQLARLSIPRPLPADRLANLHLALLGSPGTGKTTLARLVGQIYRDEGILPSGHLVPVSASRLIEEHVGGTAKRTAEAIARAVGGVLFIDEAYSLASNQFGAEAVAELVQAMTDHNGRLAVIIAGYTDEIGELIDGPDANPGLSSRFPAENRWELANYGPEELHAIFCHMLAEDERDQDESLREVLPDAFAHWHRAQNPRRFGNAREVRNLVDGLCRHAGSRRSLRREDFAELPGWRQWLGLQTLPSVDELLRPLEAMRGLDGVRGQLADICRHLSLILRRNGSLAGQAPGHYVFTGNAGTGKTTVAEMMGGLLHQLGLLHRSQVYRVEAAGLVGSHVGDAERSMYDALRKADNGVLFIDEAHQLVAEGNLPGAAALRVLIPEMEQRRQRLCVILAGYPEPMQRLLDSDQGLGSRCRIIRFDDYGPHDLHAIAAGMLAERGLQLSPAAGERLLRLLAFLHAHRDARFGNARLVRELIEREVQPAQARRLEAAVDIPTGDPRLATIEQDDIPDRPGFDPAQWDDVATGRASTDPETALKRLDALVGLGQVKERIRDLAQTLAVQQRRARRELAPGHYVFSGNPGTGKTTVARLMGEVFRALGLLARGHVVEVRREDLVGRYQGDAENNTKARINEALDGILFVDEAYQLNADEHDNYGRRAFETLVTAMENHRHRLCVILAGYPAEMQRLLDTNPGFLRRIGTIPFPDYSADDLLAIAVGMVAERGLLLAEPARERLAELLVSWDRRRGQRGFGNAGDVRNLVDAIQTRQARRLAPRLDAVGDDELNLIVFEDIAEPVPRPPDA